MDGYPIMRLVAKWPKLSQSIGLIGLAAVTLCWPTPVGHTATYATAALIFALASVFILCFVELISLMANTLLPR